MRLPLWVNSGSPAWASECPLLGAKQKSISGGWMSACSQERSCHGRLPRRYWSGECQPNGILLDEVKGTIDSVSDDDSGIVPNGKARVVLSMKHGFGYCPVS